jgi:hypothetical protein
MEQPSGAANRWLALRPHSSYADREIGDQAVSTVAFDTLKFAQTLRDKAKLTPEQAEGISEAFANATGEQLVTRDYLDAKLKEMQLRIGAMVVALGGVLIAVKFLGH